MNISLPKREKAASPKKSGIKNSSPYTVRFGAWGIVRAAYAEDHSVDVLLDSGQFLSRVPVPSREWVRADDENLDFEGKQYTSGDKDLPTLQSRVFIMMPTGNLDGCFVMCSGYVIPTTYAAFKKSDADDVEKSTNKINERQRVWPGNWKGFYNYITGSFELQCPYKGEEEDTKTVIRLSYPNEDGTPEVPTLHARLFEKLILDVLEGKTVDLKAWEDDIVFKHDTEGKKQSLKIFDQVKIEIVKGDVVTASFFDDLSFEHKKGSQTEVSLFGGEASITHKKGNSTVIKAFDSEITLKRGQVTIKTSSMITHDVPTYKFTGNTSVGKVTPKGTGVYCAIPVCPFSGLPQTG